MTPVSQSQREQAAGLVERQRLRAVARRADAPSARSRPARAGPRAPPAWLHHPVTLNRLPRAYGDTGVTAWTVGAATSNTISVLNDGTTCAPLGHHTN